MKLSFFSSSLLIVSLVGLSAWAGPTGAAPTPAAPLRLAGAKAPSAVAPRDTQITQATQVASGDDVRREEAAVGRRLTPQELAELRQQVRQQWATAPEAGRTAELPASGRIVPGPATKVDGSQPTHTARP